MTALIPRHTLLPKHTISPPEPASPYRTDINGLRAWAVVAVLLFHFNIPGMHAGFAGVDVFFVISGFLMTTIIVRELEGGNFSLAKFYAARARRILPALLVMIATLLMLGWFILPDKDYTLLGAQSAYASSFLSNFYFWREADYFGVGAHENWLLHTWSLAVEAHFYILFPIFLTILWKVKPGIKTVAYGLAGLFLVSLAVSILVSGWQPKAAFFLLPARGWELAAGGLAFLIGREYHSAARFAKLFFWVGAGLLVASAYFLTSTHVWPSGWALLPVLGTALIILANQPGSWLTGNPIAQWLGERSYSLYLWHWPLVVALYFASLNESAPWVGAAMALSLVLSHLSYKLVEAPSHLHLVARSSKKQLLSIAVPVLVIAGFSASILRLGYENRISPNINAIASESVNKNYRAFDCRYRLYNDSIPGCVFGEKTTDLILIGDSHSEAIASALELSAKNNSKGYVYYGGAHGCPTLNNSETVKDKVQGKCINYNNLISSKVTLTATDKPLLIFNASWSSLFSDDEFKRALVETVCSYTRSGRVVYLNRPIPAMPVHVPNTMSRSMLLGRQLDPIKTSLSDYFVKNRTIWDAQDEAARQCGAKILDPLPYLCTGESCYGSRDGQPLYYDDGHLSEHGNKNLVPMFDSIFQAL